MPLQERILKKALVSLAVLLQGLVLAIITTGYLTAAEEEGAGVLQLTGNGIQNKALQLQAKADISIQGMIARVELTQTFVNDSNEWQEGVYVFPLPDKAAVNHMEMQVGDRVIIGQIREKQAARQLYEQAKSEGKRAALVEQQRPNLFTQKIANIAPGQQVQVTLHYLQTVSYDSGQFSLRFPMTITSRYIPGLPLSTNDDEGTSLSVMSPHGWAMATTEVQDAHQISPWMSHSSDNRMQLSLTLDAGMALRRVGSLYHNVRISNDNNRYEINAQPVSLLMDRDFVLQWEPVTGASPTAAVFNETVDDQHYVMLMLLPPSEQLEMSRLAREIIFVLDTSGSMQGQPIVQAKNSLEYALTRLQPGDSFNIVEFSSSFNRLFDSNRSATDANLDQARKWLNALSANGGTEMYPALQDALSLFDRESSLQQLVFITDGAVGNEKSLFRLVEDAIGNARLFTVGIGSAPNSFFMRNAARFGRGTYTHVGSALEVRSRMDALFNKLESAVATDFDIDWSVPAETYPAKVSDLYAGEPLLVTARTDQAPGSVTISGRLAGKTWSRQLDTASGAHQTGIDSVWAHGKIEDIETREGRTLDREEAKQQILSLGLQHKLVTRFTSFLAVEQIRARPRGNNLTSSSVPNQVAQGQMAQPGTVTQQLSYPATATPAALLIVLGMLLMVIGAGSFLWPQYRLWFRQSVKSE